jgi:hypothetical protein
VTSFAVADRTRELGVRASLGCDARGPSWLSSCGRPWAPVAVGLAGGAIATVAAGGLVSGLLFGVAPRDATTLVVSILGLAVTAIIASARTGLEGCADRSGCCPARRLRASRPQGILRFKPLLSKPQPDEIAILRF